MFGYKSRFFAEEMRPQSFPKNKTAKEFQDRIQGMLFETNKNYQKIPFFSKQKIRRPNQESLESLEDAKQGTRKRKLKWVYEVEEPIPF